MRCARVRGDRSEHGAFPRRCPLGHLDREGECFGLTKALRSIGTQDLRAARRETESMEPRSMLSFFSTRGRTREAEGASDSHGADDPRRASDALFFRRGPVRPRYSSAALMRSRSLSRSSKRAWILHTRDSERCIDSPISRIERSSQYLR